MPLASTADLLSTGGDLRIAVDPASGLNRYLCPATPLPAARFGSATASVITPRGFAAADRLRCRLAAEAATGDEAYARELDRVRTDLVRLCGLEGLAGLKTIIAASGTDAHRLAARFVAALSPSPTVAVLVEAEETGSGVPLALMGADGSAGPVDGASGVGRIVTIAARGPDGSPRLTADLSDELDRVMAALPPAARALVVLADVSKTGLVSLDPATVLGLRRRYGERVVVLVDACQFRLAAASLRTYLDSGAMVAVTGSKFLGGPLFSGALFVPPSLAERFAGLDPPKGLGVHSRRAELPVGWTAAAGLPATPNLGLLLRWEAALAELAAFRALPDRKIADVLGVFAAAARARIEAEPALEALAAPALDRTALGAARWDSAQTIFPFLLRHVEAGRRGAYFSREETDLVYRTLATRPGGVLQLGQSVACGRRDGVDLGALRFCASAPLAVEAAGGEGARAGVLERLQTAFDNIAAIARAISLRRAQAGDPI